MQFQSLQCALGQDDYTFYDSPSELRAACARAGARGYVSSDLSWYGGVEFAEALDRCEQGDSALVAASDRLLAALEDRLPLTRKWRNIDDVVGALPVVPNFIAGQPISMRRRVRVERDDAPICIFIDCTSSASVRAETLLARGACALALARALVAHRAVELWSGIAIGDGGGWGNCKTPWSHTIAWQIDCAPLDLARAAHMLSAPSVSRGLGHPLASAGRQWPARGPWPFDDHSAHRASAKARLACAMGGRELVYIPPIHGFDELVSEPLAWLERELARLSGAESASGEQQEEAA